MNWDANAPDICRLGDGEHALPEQQRAGEVVPGAAAHRARPHLVVSPGHVVRADPREATCVQQWVVFPFNLSRSNLEENTVVAQWAAICGNWLSSRWGGGLFLLSTCG